jgi:hypothetical protein
MNMFGHQAAGMQPYAHRRVQLQQVLKLEPILVVGREHHAAIVTALQYMMSAALQHHSCRPGNRVFLLDTTPSSMTSAAYHRRRR